MAYLLALEARASRFEAGGRHQTTPSWRNWQTRWFQGPVVPGSNPGEGTIHAKLKGIGIPAVLKIRRLPVRLRGFAPGPDGGAIGRRPRLKPDEPEQGCEFDSRPSDQSCPRGRAERHPASTRRTGGFDSCRGRTRRSSAARTPASYAGWRWFDSTRLDQNISYGSSRQSRTPYKRFGQITPRSWFDSTP